MSVPFTFSGQAGPLPLAELDADFTFLTTGTQTMWDRHYAFEWMGVPPDVAAYGYFTRGIRQVMTAPPEYPRRDWPRRDWPRARYSKV
jgi:hypothetical protein